MLREKGFFRAIVLIAFSLLAVYGFSWLDLHRDQKAVIFAGFLFICMSLLHWRRSEAFVSAPIYAQPAQPYQAIPQSAPIPVSQPNNFVGNIPQPAAPAPTVASQPITASPRRSGAYDKPVVHPGSFDHFLFEEIEVINKLLAAHKIEARVPYLPNQRIGKPYLVTPTSFIAYCLDLKPGEAIAKIDKILDELSIALAARRRQLIVGYRQEVVIRLNYEYPLSIQVPNPTPEQLLLKKEDLGGLTANQGLVGMAYDFDGVRRVIIDLAKGDYHVLIAGMSQYGKSNAMRLLLTSLAANNDPGRLKFLLMDFKGHDLKVLQDLPHTLAYTNEPGQAKRMIKDALVILRDRSNTFDDPFRLVIAVDEMARLDEESKIDLAQLENMGAELRIHVIGGTQSTTGKEIGSEVVKGFSTRLVTRAPSAAMSTFYTTVTDSGAEKISRPGDFLLVRSGRIERISVFSLSREDNAGWVKHLIQKFGAKPQPVVTFPPTDPDDLLEEITDGEGLYDLMARDDWKGIKVKRELTAEERAVVRQLAKLAKFFHNGQVSKSRLAQHVYGSRDPYRDAQIVAALQEVVEEEVEDD